MEGLVDSKIGSDIKLSLYPANWVHFEKKASHQMEFEFSPFIIYLKANANLLILKKREFENYVVGCCGELRRENHFFEIYKILKRE